MTKPYSFASWITVLGFLLLYLPLITVITTSFIGPEAEWTLHWYYQLAKNHRVWEALQHSLFIAFWNTLGATFLGTLAAFIRVKSHFPGRRFLDTLIYLPLVMPEIVMGLSLLVWFVFLKFTLGTFSVILAHITFSTSYVMITVKSKLQNFDLALLEAAEDLGATPYKVFYKVTFPILWPSILSGALMAFTLSFDDFLITFFTAGVNQNTLPLQIYSMIKFGVTPEINALSTLLVSITFILITLIFKLTGKTSTLIKTSK